MKTKKSRCLFIIANQMFMALFTILNCSPGDCVDAIGRCADDVDEMKRVGVMAAIGTNCPYVAHAVST